MVALLGPRISKWSDTLLDWVVGAIAGWTLVFHLARLIGVSRDVSLLIWLTVLCVTLVACRIFHSVESSSQSTSSIDVSTVGRSGWGPVAGGLIGASILAWLDVGGLWWPIIWLGILVALMLGLRVAWFANRTGGLKQESTATSGASASIVFLALAAAFLSLVMVRPDQDDVFVVNRSTWVSEHPGVFPERDTIFSNDSLPSERPAALPTSVEGLIGGLAAHLPGSAAGLTYLIFAPFVSGLGVLATWRLLRGLGARSPVVATWVGTGFLVLDGQMHASFGNFFAGRAWQGKAIFLILLVPILWHQGAEWGRTGGRRCWLKSALAILAGLGLTSSAAFLGPAVLLSAMTATALDRDRLQRLGLGFAATLPAIAAGAYAVLAEPQRLEAALGVFASIDVLRLLDSGTEPSAVIRMVFGDGLMACIALACSLTAWATVGDRSARLVLLAGPIAVFGGFLAPGVLDLMNEVGDADAVAWRTLWVLPLPAMVGLVMTVPNARRKWQRAMVPIAAVVGLTFVATPITSSANRGTQLVWPPAHDLPRPEAASATKLISLVPEGGQIAGPEDIDFAFSVLTTRARATNPRSSYLAGRHVDEGFGPQERALLSRVLDSGIGEYPPKLVSAALDKVAPDVVCLRVEAGETVATLLQSAGYLEVSRDVTCRFWLRQEASELHQ